ncbi:MAG: spore cortex-lytic enzyme [Bacillota bacterium]|nr:spore cortex-lytic enzyme [Bacillota bacterium]
MKKKTLVLIIVTVVITSLLWTSYIFKLDLSDQSKYREAISYYGSRGQEVINIQDKLYKWGYYNGIVDGIYGYETFQAVKYFQSKNGLTADGIAGPETLAGLTLPTGTSSSSQTSATPNSDVNTLAHLIYGEARGEPYEGQVAVGAVILNRTRDSRFPKTVAGVIYQPGAFDAVSDGQINLDPDKSAYNAARDAINGWDPSGGAIYYFNPSTATSSWIWSRTIITVIGRHDFAI